MWDGTLSPLEFRAESMAFLQLWNSASTSNHQWQWQPSADSTAGGYLTLEDIPMAVLNNSEGDDQRLSPKNLHISMSEENLPSLEKFDCSFGWSDAATVILEPPAAQQHVLFTYHVIYNDSYKVATLFFRGYYSDGRLFSWEDFQSSLTAESLQLIEQSRWTFLTQEEHPFLHRPWFSLHPCGTSSIMAMVLSNRVNRSSKEEPNRTQVGNDYLKMNNGSDLFPIISSTPDRLMSNSLQVMPSSLVGLYLLTWLSFVGTVMKLEIPLNLFKRWSTLYTD